MPKFFVMSDIHGYYDEMIVALSKAGFDRDNPNHWFVGCGDFFDRGHQPFEVMDFVMSLDRKILIKGNHESLLEALLERGVPDMYDGMNGTDGTVLDFTKHLNNPFYGLRCEIVQTITKDFLDSMVDYFETKNYVFVHSFVPTDRQNPKMSMYTAKGEYKYRPDWRAANYKDWEYARWGDPFLQIKQGAWQEDKTLVFGHWHASRGWADYYGYPEFRNGAKFDPFYGDNFIALDACTAHTGFCNCVVIEDEFLGE